MPRRASLFWDVDPKTIDPKKHARYVIERVADFGNDKEVSWVFHQYSKRLLRNVIARSRCLRPRTKTLWSLLLKTENKKASSKRLVLFCSS